MKKVFVYSYITHNSVLLRAYPIASCEQYLKMIIWMVFLLFIGSPKASRVLLIGEKAETQLVALFEEATSSDFQVSTGNTL